MKHGFFWPKRHTRAIACSSTAAVPVRVVQDEAVAATRLVGRRMPSWRSRRAESKNRKGRASRAPPLGPTEVW